MVMVGAALSREFIAHECAPTEITSVPSVVLPFSPLKLKLKTGKERILPVTVCILNVVIKVNVVVV